MSNRNSFRLVPTLQTKNYCHGLGFVIPAPCYVTTLPALKRLGYRQTRGTTQAEPKNLLAYMHTFQSNATKDTLAYMPALRSNAKKYG